MNPSEAAPLAALGGPLVVPRLLLLSSEPGAWPGEALDGVPLVLPVVAGVPVPAAAVGVGVGAEAAVTEEWLRSREAASDSCLPAAPRRPELSLSRPEVDCGGGAEAVDPCWPLRSCWLMLRFSALGAGGAVAEIEAGAAWTGGGGGRGRGALRGGCAAPPRSGVWEWLCVSPELVLVALGLRVEARPWELADGLLPGPLGLLRQEESRTAAGDAIIQRVTQHQA